MEQNEFYNFIFDILLNIYFLLWAMFCLISRDFFKCLDF